MKSFELTPGVVMPPTKASRSINWRDSNLMRWNGGKMQPIPGWAQTTYALTASPIRRIFEWRDNIGIRWTAFLCDEHVYVDREGVLVDITPTDGMAPPPMEAGGFGDGYYDTDEYGTPRPPSNRELLNPTFTLVNWGQDLLIMTSFDGRLLRWSPSNPTSKAEAVPNAPIGNRGATVTPDRFCIVFDYDGNAGSFAWCGREDLENWDFSDPLGTAGWLPVYPPAPHHSSLLVPGGVLTFSQRSVFTITNIGAPLIHGTDTVDETGNVPASDRTLTTFPNGAMWFSKSGVWVFDGVGISPVGCPLWSWVEDNCDFEVAKFTAAAIHVASSSEIYFFFPSLGASKNDKYILYNYLEGWWANGRLSRSAGVSSAFYTFPLMADDKVIYQHDNGNSYPGAPELPWVESYSIISHEKDSTLTSMEPDLEGNFQDIRFVIKYRNSLSRGKTIQSRETPVINDRAEFMLAAREFRLRIETVRNTYRKWTLGNSGIEIHMVGKK